MERRWIQACFTYDPSHQPPQPSVTHPGVCCPGAASLESSVIDDPSRQLSSPPSQPCVTHPGVGCPGVASAKSSSHAVGSAGDAPGRSEETSAMVSSAADAHLGGLPGNSAAAAPDAGVAASGTSRAWSNDGTARASAGRSEVDGARGASRADLGQACQGQAEPGSRQGFEWEDEGAGGVVGSDFASLFLEPVETEVPPATSSSTTSRVRIGRTVLYKNSTNSAERSELLRQMSTE